nr:MAG TPA: tail protein [Caudoviricetes sp.]
MSYTKKIWKTGDVITAEALNNLEEGASANASAIAEIEKELPSYVGADVPRKAAETITPGTENQTIAANQYLTGAQTIEGDGNLSAGNIKKGVSIFGVSGTLETGSTGTDTSDATATAGDILYGETAYVRGEKVTGTIKSVSAATITPGTENQTIASGQYLAGAQTIMGDSSLIPANIKKGISIFGVGGTAEMDTSDATAEAGDILSGKTAYIASGKVTGTLRTSTRLLYAPYGSSSGDATVSETSYTPPVGSSFKKIFVKAPSVTSTSGKTVIDASNVEIGVEVDCYDFGNAVAANVLSGKTFTASPGLKVHGTMASKEAETITPGVDDQTIAANQYLAGAQTIKGDSNLVAENIKSGVSIFGVIGTLEAGSAGKTVKTGSFTGTASEVAIETGLSSISAFMVYDTASRLHAEGLVCAFVDVEGGITGRGIGCSSYSSYIQGFDISDTNVLNVAGGTITVLSTSTAYKPISNTTYKWFAVGEA